MAWHKFKGTVEHGEPRWWSCFRCQQVFAEDPGWGRCPACGTFLVTSGSTTIRHADGRVQVFEPTEPPVFVFPDESQRRDPGRN